MTYPEVPEELPPDEGLSAYEVAFAALVLAALNRWLAKVKTAVLGGFERFRTAPSPGSIGATVPFWTSEVSAFMPYLESIAKLGWKQGGSDLHSTLPWTRTNQFVNERLNVSRNLLVRISDEVYRDILTALNGAVAAGGGVQEQETAVRKVLDGTGSENWPARARTVAVTEVNRAYGYGVVAHGLTVQQVDQTPILKVWDAKDDSRTRRAHEDADGQIRPVSQPFIVDFEPLMAPGDPSGRASNVINCRCKPRLRRIA